MPAVEIRAEDLAREIARLVAEDVALANMAAVEAAQRGVARAVERTNDLGLVDLAHFKNSWKAEGTALFNDAPHAAVIEFGRRPGRPGPPLEPILAWVNRKLVPNGVVQAGDAERVAFAIRRKIHLTGSRPRRVLRDLVPLLRRDLVEAILRRLRRE